MVDKTTTAVDWIMLPLSGLGLAVNLLLQLLLQVLNYITIISIDLVTASTSGSNVDT